MSHLDCVLLCTIMGHVSLWHFFEPNAGESNSAQLPCSSAFQASRYQNFLLDKALAPRRTGAVKSILKQGVFGVIVLAT